MKFYAVLALLLLGFVAFTAAEIDSADEQPEAACICPRMLDPVCGDDFVTYPNKCEFACAQKKMARRGRSIAIAHAGYC